MKKIIIFDLDGTLNKSKMPLDKEMAVLLCLLLEKVKVVVISGASFRQFKKQFLKDLNCSDINLRKLFLMPTSGGSLYEYKNNEWTKAYDESLSQKEIQKVHNALNLAITNSKITPPVNIYGKQIEDRGSQVTYSALGQSAPIELKEKWDTNHNKRNKIVKILASLIPEFEIHIGGTTSIDITKKGVDKASGVEKIKKYLKISKKEMLFMGDAIFPGGNDYSVKKTGIEIIKVSGPEDTKKNIRNFLNKI